MQAVDQIIALAEKLRECRDLAARADSLEQAIRESEERLKSLRAAETVLRAEADRARAVLNEQEHGAKVQAEAIRASAEADARRARAACDTECARLRREAADALDAVDAEHRRRSAECDKLEAEESRLAQSVTALKAELDALRARVLG